MWRYTKIFGSKNIPFEVRTLFGSKETSRTVQNAFKFENI
jgi:hypothetical protein